MNNEYSLSEITQFKTLIRCYNWELFINNKDKILKNEQYIIKGNMLYYGTIIDNNIFHGFGILKKNNWIYTGQFHFNKRHGHGKQVNLINHNEYEGEWRNDRPHGIGKFINNINKTYSEGGWVNGNFHCEFVTGIPIDENNTEIIKNKNNIVKPIIINYNNLLNSN